MGSRTQRVWLGMIFFVGLWGGFGLASADPVTLKLQLPEGRKARYKHSYRFEYFGDRAELLGLASLSSVAMSTQAEWKSTETVEKLRTAIPEGIPENVMGLATVIQKANSSAIFMEEVLPYSHYPFTFDLLNDRNFIWWISPMGKVEKFEPNFSLFELKREDLVTDLFLAWVAEYSPLFPDDPVDVGDTWTEEVTYERPFGSYDMMGRNAGFTFESTYKVKKIKKKKKNTEVEITEERRIKKFGAWLEVNPVSIYLEDEAAGDGVWVFDASQGLVLSHKMHIFIDNPDVIRAGLQDILPEMEIEVNIYFERKLEKLEKE